jgi:D-alanine-D-alanine ligase-like ATP-grasp enzyme
MAVARHKRKLSGISDIRRFFHRNETPIYFISATNFNLLGMDEWVKNFKFISYIDCYDGRHPNTFVPPPLPHQDFQSIEDINNYLLQHPAVKDYIRARGGKPKAAFLMFDETTEALSRKLGMQVWFPRARLRNGLDNKIQTVRVGNKAGVPSVPNVLAAVDSYAELRKAAVHLGRDLVVQTPFGDSGHTTFFVSAEADWKRYAQEITAERELKIMKRIDCRQAAIEACTTRAGTVVGPLMTELVGFPELTPYKGGWCGNEIFADSFTARIRAQARDLTFRFGEQLRKEGYRGYFELDFLIDKKSGRIYLGELNPRVTGASSMTNHAAFAHADLPLFMLHLLEFSRIDFDFDVDGLNQRWSDKDNIDSWSQMVIKHVDDTVDVLAAAPQTGIWRLNADDTVAYSRFDYHRRAVGSEREAFFLRISGPGDFRYEGADLGILITRGRLMTKDFKLNERAHRWIAGIRAQFVGRPIQTAAPLMPSVPAPGAFKIL